MGEHICFRRNERLATVNPYLRGNPMVRGRFFNRQHRFRPGMGSVLKWRLSSNPQRKEKKTVKWDPKVCYLRSLDAVVGDSLIWLGHNSFFLHLQHDLLLHLSDILHQYPIQEKTNSTIVVLPRILKSLLVGSHSLQHPMREPVCQFLHQYPHLFRPHLLM